MGYDTDSILWTDVDTEIALNAFLFKNMNRDAVYQLKNFFWAYFNTFSAVCAFFHIDLYVPHYSSLLLKFHRITGNELESM